MTREWLDEADRRREILENQQREGGHIFDCPICKVDVAEGEMENHQTSDLHLENVRQSWGVTRVEIPRT